MTQEELDREYVDGPEAARIMGVTDSRVRQLCGAGRFPGLLKVGTSGWLIPRASVENFQRLPRGPKPKAQRKEEDKSLLKSFLEARKQQ